MAVSLRPALMRTALAMQRTTAMSMKPAPGIGRSSLGLQKATFRTTPLRAILPPLPQSIKGNMNDAAPVPHPEPTHGSYHWSFERAISIALVPATLIPFVAGVGSPIIDSVLIAGVLLHSYIGFSAAVTDYFPKWRVPGLRKVCDYLNVLALFFVGYGFYEFETNDVGLTEAIKKIWRA